jgi:hypothetical protein
VLRPQNSRIPVTAGPRLVEMADPQRVLALLRAPNVRVVRRHKRTIVELQLLDFGDGATVPPKWGKPQKLSTNLESDDNPARVWKFKRLSPIVGVS